MDGSKRKRRKAKRDNIPKHPIQTYKWEDVRRSRKRGAYPWTHVTKPPFDEEVDPEEYTMDAFRRSRSTSTIGKSETTQDISECEELDMQEELEEDHPEIPEDKENVVPESRFMDEPGTSETKTRSVTPQLVAPAPNNGSRSKSEEPKKKRKLSIESSYSRISLSKLALMDKLKNAKNKLKVPKLPKRSKSDASEAKQPKKQKTAGAQKQTGRLERGVWLPTPSNETPVYIHIPLKPPAGETDEYSKLEFESPGPSSHSGSLTNLLRVGSGRKMSLLGILTEIKKVHDIQQQKLAGESKKPKPDDQSPMEVDENQSPGEPKPSKSKVEAEDVDKNEPNIELVESIDSAKSQTAQLEVGKARVQRKESDRLVIEEITDEDRKSNKSVASKSESDIARKPRTPEPIVDEPEDSSADDNISQYLDKEDKCEIVSEKSANVSSESVSQAGPSKVQETKPKQPAETSTSDVEKLRKLEATLSKWKKQVPTVSPAALAAFSAPIPDSPRQRAKSEEPKRKRRSSIESSYSRKSLSKLAFMKRLKEAKDKIKLPKFPSFTKSDKKQPKKADEEKPVVQQKKSKNEPKKPEAPVYIHIPLKLPPGQTDEFSHLAEATEEKPQVPPAPTEVAEKPEEGESSVPTSPDVPSDDVQIIILTPPSDDEILSASVPETPSETDQKFFECGKIDDLKNLAKKAVDAVYPDGKKLETVTEDEGSDEQSAPESSQDPDDKQGVAEKQQLQILVDEEDGLKLSEAAIAMINEEMAKEIKEQGLSLKPSLKKKVSFKRRSRAEDGERIYEDVELNKNPAKETEDSKDKTDSQAKLTPLESFQSMSVDEEKSYLDKKIMKDTSLEDDYKKWSTVNDHEYEPVNPPSEEMTRGSPVVLDLNQQPGRGIDSKTSSLDRRFVRIPADEDLVVQGEDMPGLDDNLSAQEVQNRIEDRFFNATPETTSSRTEGEINTSQVDSSALETLPLKKESRKKPVPDKKEEAPGKSFNETLRTHANKLKTKLQSIKKPNINLPQRPKFPSTKLKKPNFKKPSFTMPKMPDRHSLPSLPSLPSFGLTRKDNSKDSWRERQLSTESNAGDSTKKIFDFSTYPRIFDKYKKSKEKEAPSSKADRGPTPPPPEFATVPRANRKKGPVGSRWANKFKDIKYADEDARKSKEFEDEDVQDVIKIPLRPDNEDPMDMPSHTRYNEDIDIEDDFDRENRDIHRASPFSRDYLKRWNYGEFHEDPQLSHQLPYRQEFDRGPYKVTDLDNDMEETQLTPPGGSFEMRIPRPKEEHSSGSLSDHRRGVLEEIDSDEFFLREKGISQDNIEVGKYLSSEIREAFRNPVNALAQLQSEDREYDLDVSDQSEPLQGVPKRKPLRKPKRKKTPHVSKEQVSFDRESITTEPEEYPKPFEEFKTFVPPTRPKRKSKKNKKKKSPGKDVLPHQPTIPFEEPFEEQSQRGFTPTDQRTEIVGRSAILHGNILGDNQQNLYENGMSQMYENEHMKGIEQPEIKVSDPYYRYENFQRDIDKYLEENVIVEAPTAPRRKHRSLKSLNASEPESIAEDLQISKEIPRQDVKAYRAEEYIIPTPEPPDRPKRTRSRTQSQSGTSQQEDDRTSRGAESLVSYTQPDIPCVEEPCVQDIRDDMGYAIIDKSKVREPPLPPSRFPSTPPRARRSKRSTSKTKDKFSTVPRSLHHEGPPVRPLRNYSTLGGSGRTSRSKSPTSLHSEDKENIDMGQYIEIEEGHPVRRLQSGAIIQKMRDRPLPAPPRPPRRVRGAQRQVFRDISHERNIPTESQTDLDKSILDETEVSTQTEPADEFLCEEQVERHDRLLTDIEQQILPFDYEETVTHAALVVQPINNAKILPHSQIRTYHETPINQQPVERIVPVTREYTPDEQPFKQSPHTYDDEETSEIPEEFTKLISPQTHQPPSHELEVQQPQHPQQEPPLDDSQEIGILKAQKLQVVDLDVDKLRVNELQASKIIVSELDGVSLQVFEINSKSGSLVLSGIELPPHVIQEMLDRLQSAAHEQPSSSTSQHTSETRTVAPEPSAQSQTEDADSGQKKTSIDELPLEEAPPVPPRYDSKTDLLEEEEEQSQLLEREPDLEPPERFDIPITEECQDEEEELIKLLAQETLEPPVRPPRKSSQTDKLTLDEVDQAEEPKIETLQQPDTADPEPLDLPRQNLEEPASELHPMDSQLSLDSLPPADQTSKSEEEPPPRPPQPTLHHGSDYIPSQPPASFYELRSHPYADFVEEDIPLPPRRKRHHKAPTVSRSSSDDVPPTPRRHHRSPEPSIPQLTGQLVRACATETDRSLKRLIEHVIHNVFHNADGKQDLHVMMIMLLILIAGLILLSGDERITIHHHHWEFFNPPKDL